jgi:DNA-binding IclR family transcriptional regulator
MEMTGGRMGTTSKALTLLDYFTRTQAEIGLSDLARLSGTNKATCFRLMTELQDHGLIEQTTSKTYRIGPAVLRLAALREATVPTRDAAMPVLQALARGTGETAHMSHLVAGRLVTLAFAYAPNHAIKVMMEDADILPFHATSSGMAVLAHLPGDVQAAILAQPRAGLTRHTILESGSIQAEMTRVQARGWAETADTFEVDVASIAVPLFNGDAACIGAVAVAAPTSRLKGAARNDIIQRTIKAAADIMALQGGTAPVAVQRLWRPTHTEERAPV